MENTSTLNQSATEFIDGFFKQVGPDYNENNIYDIFLSKIEEPLLKAIMNFCRGNQSKAAKFLGLSRGTLRKKLKQYGML